MLVRRNLVIKITNIQQAFTCPKSATETLEQGTNHATPKAYIYIYVYIYIEKKKDTHIYTYMQYIYIYIYIYIYPPIIELPQLSQKIL